MAAALLRRHPPLRMRVRSAAGTSGSRSSMRTRTSAGALPRPAGGWRSDGTPGRSTSAAARRAPGIARAVGVVRAPSREPVPLPPEVVPACLADLRGRLDWSRLDARRPLARPRRSLAPARRPRRCPPGPSVGAGVSQRRAAMNRVPLRRLLSGPPAGRDRVLFHGTWFKGHNNQRYAWLLPRLSPGRCMPAGLLRPPPGAWTPDPGPERDQARSGTDSRLAAAGKRYRSLLAADRHQIAYFPGAGRGRLRRPEVHRRARSSC